MIAVTLVQITRCGSFHGILYLETCFGDVPLPLGPFGRGWREAPGEGPSPRGRRTGASILSNWTPVNRPTVDFHGRRGFQPVLELRNWVVRFAPDGVSPSRPLTHYLFSI